METNVNYTLVGAFVIVLISAIVLAIIWLSSGFSLETSTTYAVYSQESVSGLNIDSPVEYNGVNVGSVKSIQLDRHDPHLVSVLLSINNGTPITRGTVATITTRGITGITFIALKDKGTDLRPLKRQDGQPYPVIKTAPSLFTRLDAILNSLSTNFQKVAESLQALLNKENQQAISDVLNNLQQVTGELATHSKKFGIILDNTATASGQFTPMVRSTISMMRMMEMQTLPAASQMMINLDQATRNLTDITKEIKQNPSILIRGATSPALGPGEKR